MTHDNAPRREDARDLQAKLYREIGISAVAAALRFTTQPDPATRAPAESVQAAGQPRQEQPRTEKARAA